MIESWIILKELFGYPDNDLMGEEDTGDKYETMEDKNPPHFKGTYNSEASPSERSKRLW